MTCWSPRKTDSSRSRTERPTGKSRCLSVVDRNLLEWHDCPEPFAPASDMQSAVAGDIRTITSSLSGDYISVDSGSNSRALRLVAGLGRPFRAFLLAAAQQNTEAEGSPQIMALSHKSMTWLLLPI